MALTSEGSQPDVPSSPGPHDTPSSGTDSDTYTRSDSSSQLELPGQHVGSHVERSPSQINELHSHCISAEEPWLTSRGEAGLQQQTRHTYLGGIGTRSLPAHSEQACDETATDLQMLMTWKVVGRC